MLPGYQWRHSWIKTQRCGMAQLICGDIVHRISCLALLRKLPALWLIGHVRLFFNGYIENLQTYNNNVLHFSVHLHENCSLILGVSGGICLYELIYSE
jgi:hypothetical protein